MWLVHEKMLEIYFFNTRDCIQMAGDKELQVFLKKDTSFTTASYNSKFMVLLTKNGLKGDILEKI